MTNLAPDLFDRRFEELLEIGRARLPSLAPGWTDYNLHDPGITLMELLAWVTEAQLYSLGRMRRDERDAYAALMGVERCGPSAATGAIWPADPHCGMPSQVIQMGARVVPQQTAHPPYRTLYEQLWVAGKITDVRTLGACDRVRVHTNTNLRGTVPYLPFGDSAGPHDKLALTIKGPHSLFPSHRHQANLILGIRTDAGSAASNASTPLTPSLQVVLRDGEACYALPVQDDGTAGFSQTGALVLDVSKVKGSPSEFTLELHSDCGFARPPRVVQIGLNVVPVVQGVVVKGELHRADSRPDQMLRLKQPGLLPTRRHAVTVEIQGETWTSVDSLESQAPGAKVFVLDPLQGTVTFGNGVNGGIPPEQHDILLTYYTCDGAAGNAMRNQSWLVGEFEGTYGTNPDAMRGGSDGMDRTDQRREARRRAREEHALVTAGDLEAAAIALPSLEVARAWTPPSAPGAAGQPHHGTLTLVAMRDRLGAAEPEQAPETAAWLHAVRHALSPRIPLGQRLRVVAPRYVAFSVAVQVEVQPGYQPQQVAAAITAALQQRMTLIAPHPGDSEREFGLSVSPRDIGAWVRKADGVARLTSLQLLDADRRPLTIVSVPRLGLPKLVLQDGDIIAQRAAQGAMP